MSKYLFALLLLVFALPKTTYALPPDVPSNAWFADSVQEFIDKGLIPQTSLFRPNDKATRAEYVSLIVDAMGGVSAASLETENFDDAPKGSPYHGYFEEAGKQGWILGTNNCYGSRPCYANPTKFINRAEAAALMIRALGLTESNNAPNFSDNKPNEWYTEAIKTTASRCVLQGDAETGRVRPADNMNRAEMIVMLQRARKEGLEYPNCDSRDNSVVTEPTVKDDGKEQATNVQSAVHYCTENKWKCSTWGICNNGLQTRKCEIDYRVEKNCINPEANKPEEVTECVVTTDPNYTLFLKFYNEINDSNNRWIELTRPYDYETAMQMLDLIDARNELNGQSKVYIDAAAKRPLSDSEYEQLEASAAVINILGEELIKLQKQGLANKISNSPSYYVPTPSTPTYNQPSMSCAQARRYLNSYGGGSDSAGIEWLKTYCP